MNDNEKTSEKIELAKTAQKEEKLIQKSQRIDEKSRRIAEKNRSIFIPFGNNSTEATDSPKDVASPTNEPNTAIQSACEPSDTNKEIADRVGASVPESSSQSDSKKQSDKRLLTSGILLSTISIILMISMVSCVMIGVIDRLDGVIFIPVVNIPYNNGGTDDTQIISKAMDSVVIVSVETDGGSGTGSGIILDATGHIVTNYHVVKNATSIYVQLHGSTDNVKAELIGYSEHDDVAVIKINKKGLSPATFVTDCALCKDGERVYAIGAPKGTDYSYSVTTGIISAVNREVKIYDDSNVLKKKMRMIQTDAAVNPGNSGGPLINSAGQVVGIVTLKLDGVDGMGFALPSDGVLPLVEAIIENGSADGIKSTIASGRPLMGVTCVGVQKDTWYINTDSGIMLVPEEYARDNPDNVFKAEEDGVYVKFTSEGMDAHGKLFAGDVITKIANTRVYTADQLITVLNNLHGGDTVTLTVYRNGEYITVDIMLKEAPIE